MPSERIAGWNLLQQVRQRLPVPFLFLIEENLL
jgi:hypothetical protein